MSRGPSLRVVASCHKCDYVKFTPSTAEHYSFIACSHLQAPSEPHLHVTPSQIDSTPQWCPLLQSALAEFTSSDPPAPTTGPTRIAAVVRHLHETSERAPDVRAEPMRLVLQQAFDELLECVVASPASAAGLRAPASAPASTPVLSAEDRAALVRLCDYLQTWALWENFPDAKAAIDRLLKGGR